MVVNLFFLLFVGVVVGWDPYVRELNRINMTGVYTFQNFSGCAFDATISAVPSPPSLPYMLLECNDSRRWDGGVYLGLFHGTTALSLYTEAETACLSVGFPPTQPFTLSSGANRNGSMAMEAFIRVPSDVINFDVHIAGYTGMNEKGEVATNYPWLAIKSGQYSARTVMATTNLYTKDTSGLGTEVDVLSTRFARPPNAWTSWQHVVFSAGGSVPSVALSASGQTDVTNSRTCFGAACRPDCTRWYVDTDCGEAYECAWWSKKTTNWMPLLAPANVSHTRLRIGGNMDNVKKCVGLESIPTHPPSALLYGFAVYGEKDAWTDRLRRPTATTAVEHQPCTNTSSTRGSWRPLPNATSPGSAWSCIDTEDSSSWMGTPSCRLNCPAEMVLGEPERAVRAWFGGWTGSDDWAASSCVQDRSLLPPTLYRAQVHVELTTDAVDMSSIDKFVLTNLLESEIASLLALSAQSRSRLEVSNLEATKCPSKLVSLLRQHAPSPSSNPLPPLPPINSIRITQQALFPILLSNATIAESWPPRIWQILNVSPSCLRASITIHPSSSADKPSSRELGRILHAAAEQPGKFFAGTVLPALFAETLHVDLERACIYGDFVSVDTPCPFPVGSFIVAFVVLAILAILEYRDPTPVCGGCRRRRLQLHSLAQSLVDSLAAEKSTEAKLDRRRSRISTALIFLYIALFVTLIRVLGEAESLFLLHATLAAAICYLCLRVVLSLYFTGKSPLSRLLLALLQPREALNFLPPSEQRLLVPSTINTIGDEGLEEEVLSSDTEDTSSSKSRDAARTRAVPPPPLNALPPVLEASSEHDETRSTMHSNIPWSARPDSASVEPSSAPSTARQQPRQSRGSIQHSGLYSSRTDSPPISTLTTILNDIFRRAQLVGLDFDYHASMLLRSSIINEDYPAPTPDDNGLALAICSTLQEEPVRPAFYLLSSSITAMIAGPSAVIPTLLGDVRSNDADLSSLRHHHHHHIDEPVLFRTQDSEEIIQNFESIPAQVSDEVLQSIVLDGVCLYVASVARYSADLFHILTFFISSIVFIPIAVFLLFPHVIFSTSLAIALAPALSLRILPLTFTILFLEALVL